jgi:DNA repair protein RadD
MPQLDLRTHQVRALGKLREAMRRHRAVILYGPTGFGKTEIGIALMNATSAKGNRAAFVVDRIILCDQTSDRLQRYGIDHGVLMSGHWRYRPYERLQVCSVQTLEARESFPGVDLLIIDECHVKRDSVAQFIRNNPNVRVIGLSASPLTRGLGRIYESVVNAVTTRQLVDDGWLVPLRVYVAKQIDMTGARKVAGEWSEAEATKRGVLITGDVVAEWAKKTTEVFGGPRKTIVFCAGVAHGEDLARGFAAAGYNFVSISYRDDDEFKRQAIEEFRKPDSTIHGLIATDILTKGFDVPDVLVGVSARPFSKSLSAHIQQMGRVMRPFDGKEFALWLDHSGNYLRFRYEWESIYESGIDGLDDAAERTKREPTDREKEAAKCPSCGSLWPPCGDTCLHCGHVRTRRNDVIAVPGALQELGDGKGKAGRAYTAEFKRGFYAQLIAHAIERGFASGWAFHKYREKFGVSPAGAEPAPAATIDPGTARWIMSRNIAWAKSRRREEARP